jgi:hypothetical protein
VIKSHNLLDDSTLLAWFQKFTEMAARDKILVLVYSIFLQRLGFFFTTASVCPFGMDKVCVVSTIGVVSSVRV